MFFVGYKFHYCRTLHSNRCKNLSCTSYRTGTMNPIQIQLQLTLCKLFILGELKETLEPIMNRTEGERGSLRYTHFGDKKQKYSQQYNIFYNFKLISMMYKNILATYLLVKENKKFVINPLPSSISSYTEKNSSMVKIASCAPSRICILCMHPGSHLKMSSLHFHRPPITRSFDLQRPSLVSP